MPFYVDSIVIIPFCIDSIVIMPFCVDSIVIIPFCVDSMELVSFSVVYPYINMFHLHIQACLGTSCTASYREIIEI